MGNAQKKIPAAADNEQGRNNALHDAAKSGNLAKVQSQVNNFPINAKGAFYKGGDETALFQAARKGHTDVVKFLLTVDGIDVNIPKVSTLKMTSVHLISSISLIPHVYLIPYRHDCYHSTPTYPPS